MDTLSDKVSVRTTYEHCTCESKWPEVPLRRSSNQLRCLQVIPRVELEREKLPILRSQQLGGQSWKPRQIYM